MNRIYKVIYSKVRQCYVVVSELAKNQGKKARSEHTMRGNNRSYRLAAIVALTISAGSLLYPVQAEAWTDDSTNNYFTAYDKNYFDQNGKRSDDWDQVKPSNTNQDKKRVGAKNTGAIAAGMFAQAGQQTVTIGNRNAGASMGSVYVGEYKNYNTPTSTSVLEGVGNNYVTSVGFMSNATKYGTIAIGAGASAKGEDNNVTLGNKDSSGTLVSSLPDPDKLTIHGASVSLGYSAQSEHGNIAIGANSLATGAASEMAAAAITGQEAPKSYVSVGDGKEGSDTRYRRISNVADGAADSDVATVGQLKEATGSGFHFYGTKDTDVKKPDIQKDTDINKEVDLNNYNGGGAAGEKTVAIGSKVVVTGDRSNSVGYANTVKGTLSDVYGNGNTIAKDTHNAVVLGNRNKVGSNSVAIGTWNKEKATNSVFIGGDDVSTTESGSGSPFVGWVVGKTNPDGSYTIVDGGPIHEATSDEVGDGEDLGAKRNPFSGDEEEWDDEDTNSSSVSAKAAPVSSNALFSDGPSFDLGNTTGTTPTTGTTDSTIDKVTVVGKSADASGEGSVSLGYGAKSNNGNIAIGYNSQATEKLSSDKKGYLTDTAAPAFYASVGDGKDNSAAKYRRITNVADGSDEQDAVTVAQLKKQETKLTSDLSDGFTI